MNKFIGFIILEAICLLPSVLPLEFGKVASRITAGENLKKLLNVTIPPRGYSFPKIKGPKPHEDVCIVGAGPAGIHMALILKENGYKKIRIFEKTGRVGGKSFDVQLNGSYRAQGAVFLSADYTNNLVKLAEKYDAGALHEFPSPGVCTIFFRDKIFITTRKLGNIR